MAAEKLYTSGQIGELLSVGAASVAKWTRDGLLRTYMTPGGHRRLRASDVVAFLREHGMYVPPELGGVKKRLLFVDDDPRWLALVKRELRSHADQVEVLFAE